VLYVTFINVYKQGTYYEGGGERREEEREIGMLLFLRR